MPKIVGQKIVFDSKWHQVIELTLQDKAGNTSPYFMYRHPWSNSTGVAILCYRDVEFKREDFAPGDAPQDYGYDGTHREFLGRYEFLPAHGEEMKLGSITGGYDKPSESYLECAVRELEEEGGLAVIDNSKVISLGTTRNSKSSDNIMHLFAVDLNNCKEALAVGDGTTGEEGSYVKWVTHDDAVWSDDVLLPAMIQRLQSL